MPITQILLDLDDVLNQFTPFVLEYIGCPAPIKYDPAWGFDIIKAANELHPFLTDFTHETFWKQVDRRAWVTVPKSAEFNMLLAESEALVGRESVFVCTTPTEDPECLAGKLEWIHNYLPKWLHRQYIMTPHKYLLAKPGTLLIDDSNDNVNAFRYAGGRSILVPRPWNSYHGIDTTVNLKANFENLRYLKRTA